MQDIVYAIYDGEIQQGGVYNVLSSFLRGLLKGFKEAGFKAFSYDECMEKNIHFDVAIGFNAAGQIHWENVLKSNAISIFWSVDSIFQKNSFVVQKYQEFENFLCFNVTPADYEVSKFYLPKLKYMYMPHATDKDLWAQTGIKEDEKENDIVLFSSLYDFENKLETLKNSKENKILYGLVVELIEIVSKKPNSTFFELYNIIKPVCNIDLKIGEYIALFDFVTSIVEQKQKVKMIQSLSNFNVKVFGSELWKKYIRGKVEYKGRADIKESIKIMENSKISLHCQIPQLNHGLHERFLNAASVGTFNLVSMTPSIQNEFQDNFAYFNHATFEDIEQKAQYFLENKEKRAQKAKTAQEITHKNHLWKNRAIAIDELFQG